MAESEVAQFRQQQALQEQAARQGLDGPAEVASHETIIKRMERGAAYIFRLQQEGRHEEAQALFLSEQWCEM